VARTDDDVDLAGKVMVVTGANAGIGKETAVSLATLGATVVMTARTPSKGEEARAEVVRRSGSEQVFLGQLDLGSFASIRAFASWVLEHFDRLDVLVNNAGLITDTRRETADGFEEMFGVNHLGHFLLTDLLRERLVETAPARVVVLSSVAHRWAMRGQRRNDLQSTKRFSGFGAYGRSKLANAQFAFELARRLEGAGVTVHAVHPGSINSHFGGDGDTGVLGWFIKVFGDYVLRSPAEGALTSVRLASSNDPEIAGTTGLYFSGGRKRRPSRPARSTEEAQWLWNESERLVASIPEPS